MRLFPISVVLLLAGGALAIGGDPSWAGASVAVFAATSGILGLLERREGISLPSTARGLKHRPIILSLSLLLTTVGIQLVPLPASIVTTWSPFRDAVEFEKLLASADQRDPELVPTLVAGAPRPLSIAPARTWWGLGFAVALALYLVGASYGLSTVSIPGLAHKLIALGAAVVFLQIYQQNSGTATVYGWYVPIELPNPMAPFINRNHQAGWLVMVLSLALGLFAGEVGRGMRGVVPRWRDRLIWLSSNQANVTVLLLAASVVMAIGILSTQSRSGAIALLLALALLALFSVRRQSTNARRGVAALSLVVVALVALLTNGDAVMSRLSATSWFGGESRIAVWQDSLSILQDFWITGTGFNTYGVSMLHYQTVFNQMRFIEAHNDYLQLAVEGGLLVGIPALMLVASVVLEIRRRFRERADDTRTYWLRVGAVVGVLAMAFQSLVDFTLQMPGGAVMFATLLAIAIHHPRPRTASPRYAE